jgi:hypothetical protein
LNANLGSVANAIADVVIERQLPLEIVMLGFQGFLLGLERTGRVSRDEICVALEAMLDDFSQVPTIQ